VCINFLRNNNEATTIVDKDNELVEPETKKQRLDEDEETTENGFSVVEETNNIITDNLTITTDNSSANDGKDEECVSENQLNDTAPVELILNLSEVMHKSST